MGVSNGFRRLYGVVPRALLMTRAPHRPRASAPPTPLRNGS